MTEAPTDAWPTASPQTVEDSAAASVPGRTCGRNPSSSAATSYSELDAPLRLSADAAGYLGPNQLGGEGEHVRTPKVGYLANLDDIRRSSKQNAIVARQDVVLSGLRMISGTI
jgi:hypothetical protein